MRGTAWAVVACALSLASCGGATRRVAPAPGEPGAVKMRHQIMFSHGGEAHIFEGYLLVSGSALLVKAFAGPGVDLFTIVRNGVRHREDLHISGLEGKMDLAAIGADIARVYLGGCGPPGDGAEVSCDLFGEPLVERYGEHRRLEVRHFPQAYGVGLDIIYSEYTEKSGRWVPQRISLAWGQGDTHMEIRLLSYEILEKIDPGVFEF